MSAAKQTWTLEQVVELLRKVEFFQGLPEDDLRRIAGIVRGKTLGKGEILFREGDPGDAFYIVFRGAVEILKEGPGQAQRLAVRRDGGAFGEMSLLNDAPRSATARAVENTHLLAVGKERFVELLGGDTLAVRLLRNLATALRALNVRLAVERGGGQRGEEPGAYEYARLIQRALLPRHAPPLEGYDVAAGVSQHEDGRGTAFWDWSRLGDGRPVLAAVSTRADGVPGAHQLAVVRALFREIVGCEQELRTILPRINDALAATLLDELEQQVACALIAVGDSEIEWSSAGQAPGAVVRGDGTVLELPSQGPPLGVLEGFEYPSQRHRLPSGDGLLAVPGVSTAVFRGAADLAGCLRRKPAAEVVATLQTALDKVRSQLPAGQDTVTVFLRRER